MIRVATVGGLFFALLTWAACQTDESTGSTDELGLRAVEPAAGAPAQIVRVVGQGFSLNASENVVLFDGVRARVRSASESVLEVEVPPCLPERGVDVTVTVEPAVTAPLRFDVRGSGPPPTAFGIGEHRVVQVTDGADCLKLSGRAKYLLVVQSIGTVAGARYPFSLRGLTADSPGALGMSSVEGIGSHAAVPSWKKALRHREDAALPALNGEPALREMTALHPSPPAVGDERIFKVVDAGGTPREVRATARWVGEHVALYQDREAPDDVFSESDLRALGRDFDEVVFPTVTNAFGDVSDLDANERIVVLFTPAVNRLTPSGSSVFVGGFFFGVDLLPSAPNSNASEILYALVPDPAGSFGPPQPMEWVRRALPSVLAHEFQHLIHFHQRMRVHQAPRNEALWISEALAQSAEVLVGEALIARGRPSDAELYIKPTLARAREFLSAPGDVSLLISEGSGTLAERGAAWLFLRYLGGQNGALNVMRALTWTTRTGIENLEAVTGRGWLELYSNWSVANFADGLLGFPNRSLQYADLDIREALSSGDMLYPLTPRALLPHFVVEGVRVSASAEFFTVDAPSADPLAVRLAAVSGGAPPTEARLVLTVVRIE